MFERNRETALVKRFPGRWYFGWFKRSGKRNRMQVRQGL
jgi:hypothetical protein